MANRTTGGAGRGGDRGNVVPGGRGGADIGRGGDVGGGRNPDRSDDLDRDRGMDRDLDEDIESPGGDRGGFGRGDRNR